MGIHLGVVVRSVPVLFRRVRRDEETRSGLLLTTYKASDCLCTDEENERGALQGIRRLASANMVRVVEEEP